jgi:hypothetical protein
VPPLLLATCFTKDCLSYDLRGFVFLGSELRAVALGIVPARSLRNVSVLYYSNAQ